MSNFIWISSYICHSFISGHLGVGISWLMYLPLPLPRSWAYADTYNCPIIFIFSTFFIISQCTADFLHLHDTNHRTYLGQFFLLKSLLLFCFILKTGSDQMFTAGSRKIYQKAIVLTKVYRSITIPGDCQEQTCPYFDLKIFQEAAGALQEYYMQHQCHPPFPQDMHIQSMNKDQPTHSRAKKTHPHPPLLPNNLLK